MSQVALSHDVYAVRDGDWIIFLDIARNRYSAIAAHPACDFERLTDRRPLAASELGEPAYTALTAQGLLRPLSACAACASPAARRAGASVPLFEWCAFASTSLWYARRLKRGDLRAALERVQIRKLRAWRAAKCFDSAAPAFASYCAMRLWAPTPYVCLFNSLLLADHLLVHGLTCDLVFGVRARPFAAHCWVEADGAVLDDGEEDCGSFVEILRV